MFAINTPLHTTRAVWLLVFLLLLAGWLDVVGWSLVLGSQMLCGGGRGCGVGITLPTPVLYCTVDLIWFYLLLVP